MGRNKQIIKIHKLEKKVGDLQEQIPIAQGMLMTAVIQYIDEFEKHNRHMPYDDRALNRLRNFCKNYTPKEYWN